MSAEVSLRRRLVGGTMATTAIKAAGMGFAFAIGVVLARALGAEGLGAYAYAMAWVNLLALPAAAGLHTIVVRDVAAAHVRKQWGLTRGLLAWSSRAALGFSLALGAAAFGLATVLGGRTDPRVVATLWISLPLVPLAALTRLRQAALQGLRHPSAGEFPEYVVEPTVFLVLLGIAATLAFRLTAETAMVFNVAATFAAFLVGTRILLSLIPREVKEAEAKYQPRQWIAAALPLLAFFAMSALNQRIDIVLLQALRGSAPVGIYSVAFAGAELLSLVYLAAHTVVSPAISSLYAEGQLGRLQRMLTASSRWIFGLTLPAGLALIVLAQPLLRIFGPEFVAAVSPLAILCVGRLVNVATGWNLASLMMTGYQREAASLLAVMLALNVVVSAALISAWGINGAAAGSAIRMIVWNLLLSWQLRARTGLDSSILGLPVRPSTMMRA
ncbi:MAG TPA: flippase [bacterium]|nr:flippase [bacterium]